MITIVELARLSGVSTATVSMVLSDKDRGRVSAARRQQILGLARKHGYRTNPAARALVGGRNDRIGLCVAGTITSHALIGEFSLHMRLELFAEGLQRAGYAIELVQIDPDQPRQTMTRHLTQRPVDGLVFLNWQREILEKPLLSITEKGIPAVASGTSFDDSGFTWTDIDEPALIREAVAQLLREGRSHIALVDIVLGPSAAPAISAFRSAMESDPRLTPQPLIIRPERPDYDSVRHSIDALLRQHAQLDGLILTDNFLAQAVLNALRERGRTPGRDVRVIGCGDTVFADQCSPGLSHYSLRVEEQVQFGLEMLLEQIQNAAKYQPRFAKLPPKYLPRET